MFRHPRPLLLFGAVIGVAGLAFAFFGMTSTSSAQIQCENPDAEVEDIRFSTRFWERTDFCNHSVSYTEIISGGVAPDQIPPIDDPLFESIEAASEWLQDRSPVIVFGIDDDVRAYPLAILTWHEIVNDEFDDTAVAVTYCPLCNSGIVFDRTMNGETLRLGVSGMLRKSDLIMWDDVTQSWWQQLTGEGIVGDYTGELLTMLPSQMVSFGAFVEQHPEGIVLSRDTGVTRTYGRNPYAGYDSGRPFLFQGELDERLPAAERVLAGTISGEPIAYPFSVLSEEFIINDTVGGRDVVAFWQPGVASALDGSDIDTSRAVGMAALYERVVDGETLTFAFVDGEIRDEQTGSTWNVFGTATAGELEGAQLNQELAAPHLWFAWAAFSPDTALYGVE